MPPKSTKKPQSSERNCVFCNLSEDNELKFGKIYEHNGIITHYYCLLLSSNMLQRGRDEDGILGFLPVDIQKELKRGRRLICSYCKKNGATLGCCNRKCKKVFHYPCGLKNHTLHQFFGQYKSFCVSHRPNQTIDAKAIEESSEQPMCYICYDHVNRDNIYQTLWAPCCKKNAWFHRDCVQQLALSAGYFFKCPLCNNKKEFQKAMVYSGIFVPSQDASWELVPNAFQELLYRHNKCDAEKCKCPYGRQHTSANARWDLILCRTCGSQGIHMGCGDLRWINPVWDCDECSAILSKSNTYHSANNNRSINENEELISIGSGSANNYDDESNDSDISIGTDTPINKVTNPLTQPQIILRPGPRSAKLKQLQQHVISNKIEESISNTSIEQLTDLLNLQQSRHSALDKDPLSNAVEHISASNTVTKKSEIADLCNVQKQIFDDVIVVESDDDNDMKTTLNTSSKTNQTFSLNCNSNSTISCMNIKIADVTSLSPEVFANDSDVSILSETLNEALANSGQTSCGSYLLKRKADSSDVLSIIVKCINDSIDTSDVPSKKQKLDINEYRNDSLTRSLPMPSSQSHSILRGVNSHLYRNGVSLAQTPIVSFNGKNYVAPLENTMTNAASNNKCMTPNSSNSNGDAGIKCTNSMAEQPCLGEDWDYDATKSDNYVGGRRGVNHGDNEYIKTKQINDTACISWNFDTRNNRYRLMQQKVYLRDLKFYIYKDDTITMRYRDDFIMNIAVDSQRERKTVNHCSFIRIKNNSPSQTSSSNTQHNSIQINDYSRYHDIRNESIASSKCDRVHEAKITHCLFPNSTHFLENDDKRNLCKYQQKEAAKENLVPDMLVQSNNVNIGNLSKSERIGKQLRFEHNNENNIVTSRNYINTQNVISCPGTSKDGLIKLSHSSINQKHLTTISNTYGMCKMKTNSRRKSTLSYIDENAIGCRVSIDLNRIQTIFDKIPSLMLKEKNSMKYRSLDDLKICSITTMNEYKLIKSLKRSKSESNISSMCINNSSKNFENCK